MYTRKSAGPRMEPSGTPALTGYSCKENKEYNCSGSPAFKSQRVGHPSNQKLLDHYLHSKNQLNS